MLSPRSFRFTKSITNPRTVTTNFSQNRSRAKASNFQAWRATSTQNHCKMASPSKISLGIEETGVVNLKPQSAEAAAKVSELLQENHDKHHIFFNQEGFHNHIAHHLLTLYGLGASVEILEKHYKENASYQRPRTLAKDRALEDMTNPEYFKQYLGKEKYYQDFLVLFQNEMEKKGWENVLNEYLFAEDERSDDLLGRMYAGFLHPLIHLGFGIEFHQPAIIAEALAQGCVHDTWTGAFLLKAEKAAKSAQPSNKTLPELLDEIRADKKLSTAVDWNDGNKIRDGILKRAPDEMLKYATQWTVSESDMEQKTVEMINNAIYFTAAAQNPPKQVKIDFYYMHCVNSSIFYPTFNAQSWLSTPSKVRLLQWKGYFDLAMYASRRSPALLLSEITDYTPKIPAPSSSTEEWNSLFSRLFAYKDDGHAVKLGRAVLNGKKVCEKWEGEGRIKGDMWEKIGNMAVDSVEDVGVNWARSVGFKEAWVDYVDRPKKAAL